MSEGGKVSNGRDNMPRCASACPHLDVPSARGHDARNRGQVSAAPRPPAQMGTL